MHPRILGLFLLLAWNALLSSIPGAVPTGRYSFKSYGLDQGLGNPAVFCLLQDGKGFIWAGSEDGLYRFDGNYFQAYGIKEGLPSSYVERLFRGKGDVLWAGTFKGLARMENGRFKAVGVQQGLPATRITALTEGPDGALWVGTHAGPYRQLPDGCFEAVPGWMGGSVTAMCGRAGYDSVWMASWAQSRAQILRWRDGAWTPLQGPTEFGKEAVNCIVVDPQQRLWARSLRGLWTTQPGGDALQPFRPALPDARQGGYLYMDGRGCLWVPTEKGLWKIRGEQVEVRGLKSELPTGVLKAILEDREGSLWLAGDGVFRLQGSGAWQTHSVQEGLPNDTVWSIFKDRAGRLFVGTDRGLATAGPQAWRLVPGTERLQVRSIVQTQDGSLCFAGTPQVTILDPAGRLRHFGPEAGVATAGRIYQLAAGEDGALWVATEGGGLLRGTRRGEGWAFMRQELPEGTPQENFEDVRRDNRGRLWACGEHGLAVLEGSKWRRFTARDGLKSTHVSYVRATRDGSLLVVYFDPIGISRVQYDNGTFRVLGHLDHLVPVDRVIYLVGEDARGDLWIGTGRGLDLITPDLRTTHFGRRDGLSGENMNAMAFLAEPNGDLWIGTSTGLAHFDSASYKGVPFPPNTEILSFKLGNQAFEVMPQTPLRVPYRAGTFEVRFAGLSFIHEGMVQHQVRLLGLESEWHTAEGHAERYPALPHGRYRFQARARIGQGEWGSVAQVEFEVLPAWWQTWWFRTLGGLGLLGSLYALGRWRMATLRRRNRMLARMVASRTQELESANEALRSQSLTDPLTGLQNRRYLSMCMPEDVARVRRIHRDAEKNGRGEFRENIDLLFVMVDLDHFKAVNDEYGHAAGDRVLQQTADILRGATRDSDTVVRWGGEEFLIIARNASRREATILVERIHSQVALHPFDLGDGKTARMTCALGSTPFPFLPADADLLGWERVVDLADRCMYAAKRSGRDAWVSLMPTEMATAQEFRERLPQDLPGLIADGLVQVKSSRLLPAHLQKDLFGGPGRP